MSYNFPWHTRNFLDHRSGSPPLATHPLFSVLGWVGEDDGPGTYDDDVILILLPCARARARAPCAARGGVVCRRTVVAAAGRQAAPQQGAGSTVAGRPGG
jgi:hypothetical protein